MADRLHADELLLDASLVRSLVGAARPDWAELPIDRLPASGSTNALFRLGSDLLVRLPRQPGGSATIDKEALWLPRLAQHLPVAVPEVVHVGDPGFGYPERWSVTRWIAGRHPAVVGDGTRDPRVVEQLAHDLADFVNALRAIEVSAEALADGSLRWYRGDPLITFAPVARAAIDDCRALPDLDIDLDAALQIWEAGVSMPGATALTDLRWYHGDLVAENLLMRAGALAAVLDFGGLAVGDPTVDLIVAWEVLDATARQSFRRAVGVDDDTWLRGRAWALGLAMNTFPYYWHTMPDRCASRLAVVREVLSDPFGE